LPPLLSLNVLVGVTPGERLGDARLTGLPLSMNIWDREIGAIPG
jgi:hypothetical protein